MSIETTLSIRKQLAADHQRPQYHFLPPSNWMNDPNGLIQWNGQYHLFYQYNPHGPLWGTIHWGHAISDDLIHWADWPIALTPTLGGPDEAGCFSGCAVNHDGVPTLIYTGTRGERHDIQTQCIATSHDGLLTWETYSGNPVLDAVPDEAGQTSDFRDPFVWQEEDAWYMVLGSRIKDVGGAVFLFRSPNLTEWDYLHPLLVGDFKRNGAIWECPNFFPLGDQWVLMVSSHTGASTDTVLYFVGSYENHQFIPTYEGVMDYGQLYAPLTMVDDQKRRILFGWLRETRAAADQRNAGWSGVQSVPRILTLDDQKRLKMVPVPELETVRKRHFHRGPQALTQAVPLEISGLALDILAEFELEPDGYCGIRVASSLDGDECMDITYDASRRRLAVRKVSPEAHDATNTHTREVPHELEADEPLQLRILLDGSVVEVIANQRTSVTSRIYPTHTTNNGVQLLASKAQLNALDIWEMSSIWPL